MAVSPPRIRPAVLADAAACAAIYAPYVTDSVISFETEPPSPHQFAERMTRVVERYPWLVAEHDGVAVGYAYAHEFASRAAYGWSCETSIYVSREHHRGGIGRALYEVLLPQLAERGYRRAFAGITLPNAASVGLHRALGFEDCGVYRRVGWKHGAWHDVAWMQRDLASDETDPPLPVGR